MLAGTFKRTLVTVSGFTLAHSLTLAWTTPGLISLPGPLVDTGIAASTLFLAAETAAKDGIRRPGDGRSWWRRCSDRCTASVLLRC